MLGAYGQYESVALILSYKLDFICCANKDGCCKSSHIILCHVYLDDIYILSIAKFEDHLESIARMIDDEPITGGMIEVEA